ncbi:MaoC family dehydratase [Shewanella sp. ULN5]|uniref:MaoC family dehydratase n=1 Tax=Shewanella sp. ULN5 TaxID=2994678 RepID=UPI00273FA1F9|nr:MaoC family dehydratase [Shewanella sp. ULN5]MDP5148237.1 MaoC family dehydratase [Shewanella sp. ULN5]
MGHKVNISQINEFVGKETGVSKWYQITQAQINQFADATHDHQFIHVDPEAAKVTPFGGTIAHGFMSLAYLSAFSFETGIEIENMKMGLNYGFDKIRFIQPVKEGSNIRGRTVLNSVVEKKPGQYLLNWDVEVEIENESKPALIAQWLTMTIV